MDLKIPKRVLGCLHFNCIVEHIVSECLTEAPPFCNFSSCWNFPKSSSHQCKGKGWKGQLNDVSARFKDCQTPFLHFYLASDFNERKVAKKPVFFLCTVFWNEGEKEGRKMIVNLKFSIFLLLSMEGKIKVKIQPFSPLTS